MKINIPFEYPTLSANKRAKLLRYAKRLLSAQQNIITDTGQNILHYTLRGQEQHLQLSHYPKGDRIDHETGSQYFYHCHRENYDQLEHGHFHCFLRYPKIPKHIKPTPFHDWDKYIDNPMTHLVAISMNKFGVPIRLFTMNRWISKEIWYDCKHMSSILNRFKMSLTDDAYWQILDQWIEAVLHLFSPQIRWLHQVRDHVVNQYQPELNNFIHLFENEKIEELSEIQINLKTQIEWLLETPNEG
jgi:hypothetical protein